MVRSCHLCGGSYLKECVNAYPTDHSRLYCVDEKLVSKLQILISLMELNDCDIEALIEERAACRRERNFDRADEIKSYLEKAGLVVSDMPYKKGGGSTWFRKPEPPTDIGLLSLSREAYSLNDCYCPRVAEIVSLSKTYLTRLAAYRSSIDIHINDHHMLGRKYADIAFNFAMAGVDDDELFRLLIDGHMAEIKRFGHRKSCGVMDLIQMTEKLACAGCIDQSVYTTVANIIREKVEQTGKASTFDSLSSLESGRYSLLCDHPLRLLWRYAARQSKAGRQRKQDEDSGDDLLASSESDAVLDADATEPGTLAFISECCTELSIANTFHDNSLPLVLDLGCGYGVSLLGLCWTSMDGPTITGATNQLNPEGPQSKRPRTCMSRYNYLGCDMSHRSVGFARGISRRWGWQGKCEFIVCDVISALRVVEREYPGPVIWININFPTPYSQTLMTDTLRMYYHNHFGCVDSPGSREKEKDSRRNSQLPSSMTDFMITPDVLSLCQKLLSTPASSVSAWSASLPRCLYMQSNVEDVALTMRAMLESSCQLKARDGESGFVLCGSEEMAAVNVLRVWEGLTDDSVTANVDRDISEFWTHLPDVNFPSATSKRQRVWLDVCRSVMGEIDLPRAYGVGWWASSPLPCLSKTETEVACAAASKPVHRIVYAFLQPS